MVEIFFSKINQKARKNIKVISFVQRNHKITRNTLKCMHARLANDFVFQYQKQKRRINTARISKLDICRAKMTIFFQNRINCEKYIYQTQSSTKSRIQGKYG